MAVGASLAGSREERFQPFREDLVEYGILGFPAVVLAERCAGRAGVALPGQ